MALTIDEFGIIFYALNDYTLRPGRTKDLKRIHRCRNRGPVHKLRPTLQCLGSSTVFTFIVNKQKMIEEIFKYF